MDWLATGFDAAQQWLFEAVMQPLLFAGGMANFLEDGYRATGWLLVGLLQLVVIVGLLVPLQRWRPVEAITDRSAVRTDIIYTLLHRLGIFRVGLFLALDPLWDTFFGALSVGGITTFQLDSIWPGITDIPWSVCCCTWRFLICWIIGFTVVSIASNGGGVCMRCTILSAS